MDWENIVSTLANSSVLNNLTAKKPAAPASTPTPVIQVQNPIKEPMSKSTIAMIVGGVVAVVAVLYFAIRK